MAGLRTWLARLGMAVRGVARAVAALRMVPAWVRGLIERSVPAPRSIQGAAYGAVLAVMVLGGIRGSAFKSPLGLWIDVLMGVLLAVLLAWLAQFVFRLALYLLRTLPRFLTALGVGALAMLVNLLGDGGLGEGFGALVAVGVVVVEAVTGGALAFLIGPGFRGAGVLRRVTAALLLLLGLGLNVFAIYWLIAPGSAEHLIATPAGASPLEPPLDLADPSQPGPYPVLTLSYGSGTDRHRPEFGEAVNLKTEPVDATPFVKGFDGWRKRARQWFWGFDTDELPRNGRVWYPEGEGPFPLVLIVHGNHNMMEFSDPGYGYLGELLASRGFIFVSVDENFLNGSVFGGIPRENDARGWLLLKHLETWADWNDDPESPLAGKVDMERIGLIGHSRGGEAVAIASAFNRLTRYPDDATVELDFQHQIRAVIAIAPSDGQYSPADQPTLVRDVSYLVIQGGHDGDVSLFMGDRQYNRVAFTDPSGEDFKASVYAYRANHGQFNTVWGRFDASGLRRLLLNLEPLLGGEEQRQIARTYFSAFLEATLHGNRAYVDLFRSPRRAASWLPPDIYLTRYEDASFRVIAGFEEDVEVTTASLEGTTLASQGLTLWREQDVRLRKGSLRRNHGVYLGWNREGVEESDEELQVASYSLTLPEGLAQEWDLGIESLLVCQLATSSEKPPEAKTEDEEEGAENELPHGNESEGGDGDSDQEEEAEEKEEDEEDEPEPLDWTVELSTTEGIVARLPLSDFGTLVPPLAMRFTKLEKTESRYGTKPEPVFQTFEFPLADFVEAADDFDPTDLQTIRFVFDRSLKGVVIVDRVGFARRRLGD